MDASAMLEYFAPLKEWLDEQNKKNNAKEGW
jgi:peptidyl-dipeptidase A